LRRRAGAGRGASIPHAQLEVELAGELAVRSSAQAVWLSQSCSHFYLVVAAEPFRDNQEHDDSENVRERQHDENIRVFEVLDRHDYSGGSVTLGRTKSADILEMILSPPGKVT